MMTLACTDVVYVHVHVLVRAGARACMGLEPSHLLILLFPQ